MATWGSSASRPASRLPGAHAAVKADPRGARLVTKPFLRVRPMLGWQRPVRTRSGQEGSGSGRRGQEEAFQMEGDTCPPERPLLKALWSLPCLPTPQPVAAVVWGPMLPCEPQAPGSKAPAFRLPSSVCGGGCHCQGGSHTGLHAAPGPRTHLTCSSPWRATAASSDSPTQPYSRE